eukprot:COSAG06_NODE_3062_length_5904_cov_62.822911_4_plen_49_part_00
MDLIKTTLAPRMDLIETKLAPGMDLIEAKECLLDTSRTIQYKGNVHSV